MIQIKGKIGCTWPHDSSERKKWKCDENEVQFTLVIPVEDSNNEKMKSGEKITLALFHKPSKKNW